MRFVSKTCAPLAIVWMAATTQANAGSIKNCIVKFETIGKPVLVNIRGSSGEPCTGTFTISGDKLTQSEFKMNLNKLDTGIPLRNKHLAENYLQVAKFPLASSTITSIENLSAQKSAKSSGKSEFAQTFTIHGMSKPISGGNYQIKGNKVEASFRFELLDFGIERPMFMGIKVVDAVIVNVEFEINE